MTPSILDEVRQVATSGEPFEREVENTRGQSFLVRLNPYIAQGVARGVVLTLVDITRLAETQKELLQTTNELQKMRGELEDRVARRTKQIEELQEQSRQRDAELAHASRLNLLGEMLAGLAHELNQPLQAILAFTGTLDQLINNGAAHQKLVAPLKSITSEASRSGAIIQRLRQLVKRREPEAAQLHLNNVIRESIELLNREFKNHAVAIELELDAHLPAVFGDRVQLQQVVLNLLHNAIQVMDSNAPESDRLVKVSTASTGDGAVSTSIQNNGPVVPAADLAHLFDPFFTTSEDGLGLGLPISKSIIESHGGQITANPIDHGMDFRFELPAGKFPAWAKSSDAER